ncbi:F-box/LRR-repeat protein [Trifolium pratense]|uniref:F-box/LRR-repeat protein n=1 Tax=Trifolium pratense TaxID=57577 RepID=A0A2K3L279_TRIPR|nr:F-box/LRR-repeat protein [Trifolium pratense]
MHHENNNHSSCDLKPLSVVSKYFLSVTNRLRYSPTIKPHIRHNLPCLFRRFPNLTSLNLNDIHGDLDKLIQIPGFPLNLTSLHLSFITTYQLLRAFSTKITTLTSLTCSFVGCLRSTEMSKIANCFPNLQLFYLNHCYDIHEESIAHVLKTCCNIRHLNLDRCSGVKLHGINFQVPKLEVLNLSYTEFDDQTLDVISKICRGLLQLVLESCHNITKEGVMHVVENCTQLREINLKCCVEVLSEVITLMVSSSLSLRKIIVPYRGLFTNEQIQLFLCQGCLIC